jgi:hypothetical protein
MKKQWIKSTGNKSCGIYSLSRQEVNIYTVFPAYKMHQPIRRTLVFSLEILEKIMINVF